MSTVHTVPLFFRAFLTLRRDRYVAIS